MPAPLRNRPRAFTMLEVMVTVVILAILASIAVPRLSGTARRSFLYGVDQVTDLLTIYAQRDQLDQRPLGLLLDRDRRELSIMVLDVDPDDPDAGANWQRDALIPPARLPREIDTEAIVVIADGEMVNISDFPLSHTPGEARPRLEIMLQSPDQAHSVSVVLDAHGVAPRTSADGRGQLAQRAPIDLDSIGRGREDW